MARHEDARAARRRRLLLDRWLREQGMPTLSPWRSWIDDLPRRVAPIATWVTVVAMLSLAGLLAIVVALAAESAMSSWVLVLLAAAGIVITLGVAQLAYLGVRALLRRRTPAVATVLGLAVLATCGAFYLGLSVALDPERHLWSQIVEAATVLLACVLLTALGGGALLAWAVRLALRNVAAVAHMASIALPVILMMVVFALLAAETWQVGTAMEPGTLWLVAALVGLLELIVVLSVSRGELDEVHAGLDTAGCIELSKGTPVEGELERTGAALPRVGMSRIQRANALLVMAVAQLLQAALFGLLLALLLGVLGWLAVPDAVLAAWIGGDDPESQIEHLRIGATVLPITVNLLHTVALLSIIATLPFVFSAVSEERYRDRFFDPIMADLRRAIAVHEIAEATGVWRRGAAAQDSATTDA